MSRRFWGAVVVGLAAGCSGVPDPAPYEHAVRMGNLQERHRIMQGLDADAPIMKVQRDTAGVYTVTDVLLRKEYLWAVPADDPKPRKLGYNHIVFSCQGGLIRYQGHSADLGVGEHVLLRKNGTLTKSEAP